MAKRKKRKLRKNPDSKTWLVVGGLAAAAAYFFWWKPRQDEKAALVERLKSVEKAIASNTEGREKALELQAIRSEILKKLQDLHIT